MKVTNVRMYSPASKKPIRIKETSIMDNPWVVLAIFFGCLILVGAIEGGVI